MKLKIIYEDRGPKLGTTRIRSGFLFLPKATITGRRRGDFDEIRWLEHATYRQKFVEWSDGTRSWLTVEWLDETPTNGGHRNAKHGRKPMLTPRKVLGCLLAIALATWVYLVPVAALLLVALGGVLLCAMFLAYLVGTIVRNSWKPWD